MSAVKSPPTPPRGGFGAFNSIYEVRNESKRFFKIMKFKFQGDKKDNNKDPSENGGFIKTLIKIVTFGLSGMYLNSKLINTY